MTPETNLFLYKGKDNIEESYQIDKILEFAEEFKEIFSQLESQKGANKKEAMDTFSKTHWKKLLDFVDSVLEKSH